MKSLVIGSTLVVAVAGCHIHKPETTSQPTTKPAVPIVQPTTDAGKNASEPVVDNSINFVPVTKSVAAVQPTTAPAEKPVFRPEPVTYTPPKKPFFAPVSVLPRSGPSPLLLQHARSDSPIPLQQYDQQNTWKLSDFPLTFETSADLLDKQFGPPAQLADYSSAWFVYRLNARKELWLHFTQPGNLHLMAADVVTPAEDGYNRERIFSAIPSR